MRHVLLVVLLIAFAITIALVTPIALLGGLLVELLKTINW